MYNTLYSNGTIYALYYLLFCLCCALILLFKILIIDSIRFEERVNSELNENAKQILKRKDLTYKKQEDLKDLIKDTFILSLIPIGNIVLVFVIIFGIKMPKIDD